MKTPAGTECPHFYADYFRGRNTQVCRLLKAAGQQWTPELCQTCPVPEIARANACEYLKLNPTIGRPITAMFQRRVLLAPSCEKSKRNVDEPHIGCGECHALPFEINLKD